MGKHSTDMMTIESPIIISDIEDVTVILYRDVNQRRWNEYHTGLKPVSHARTERWNDPTAVYFIPPYECNPEWTHGKFECPRVWTDDGIAVGFEYL